LGPKNLLDRLGPPRSRLHGRIVGDDDGLATMHSHDRRYYSRGWGLAIVLVVRNEQSDLQHARIGVAQQLDSFAGGELPLLMQLLEALRSTGFAEFCLELLYLVAQLAQAIAHYASCFSRVANHSLMYSINSVVGVPGP